METAAANAAAQKAALEEAEVARVAARRTGVLSGVGKRDSRVRSELEGDPPPALVRERRSCPHSIIKGGWL